jgi:hypothetical protein
MALTISAIPRATNMVNMDTTIQPTDITTTYQLFHHIYSHKQ